MSTSLFALAGTMVLVLVAMGQSASALTTKIEPRQKACFTEEAPVDVPLSFQFQVTAGGKLDVDCEVFDATGRRLHAWKDATEGRYNVRGDHSSTKYKFCFGNEMAAFTPKWVNFHFLKGHHPNAAKVDQLDPIERQIQTLSTDIDALLEAQLRLRQAEHDHRNTVEDSNERMLLWSIFEALALFVMGLFNIFFVKRFLEVRTTL